LEHSSGWNLVSVPRITASYDPAILFPSLVPGAIYGFNGTYFPPTQLANGPGYWARLATAGTNTITGSSVNQVTIPVSQAGWTLIGSIPFRVPEANLTSDPPGMILAGTLYGYSGGYVRATEIEPGKGYWVRTTGPCTLRITR
jgi:hypothetical protein